MNILTIFFCLAVFTVVNCKNLRIIGGEYADIREFPYTVSLQIIKDKWYICGGAIISNWHVLTAAHCFIDIDYASVKIYVGTNESKNYTLPHRKIKSVKIHPKFSGKRKSRQNSKHDIAVVTVEPCIPFNEFQQEIDLPTVDIQPEQVAIFSGWGWSNFPEGEISERLKKISLKVLHNVECEGYFPFSIFDEQVCTLEGPDIGICFGDSGGPLVYNGQLIGICSFALPCARNHPDVYTRVYQYLDFIKSSMTMKHPMCCIPV